MSFKRLLNWNHWYFRISAFFAIRPWDITSFMRHAFKKSPCINEDFFGHKVSKYKEYFLFCSNIFGVFEKIIVTMKCLKMSLKHYIFILPVRCCFLKKLSYQCHQRKLKLNITLKCNWQYKIANSVCSLSCSSNHW